ncbi:Protein kinase C-binding protein 1 [Microtus ochrogaster]|uniref:Protein kinase C-binding protein 1 n=1 Tax=Microtus ochrogaster TaxID=79684 RepID=A0A8J6KSH4_MICOH|nr:Protein kinase C-binding protein 1 [Microtus ochrogaster]
MVNRQSSSGGNQSPSETPVLTRSATQASAAGVTVATTTSTMSTFTVTAPATAVTGSPVKKQRPLLPKVTAPAMQRVVWNSSTVQQKEVTQIPSTFTITLVTSTQPAPLVSSSSSTSTLASAINADLPIATASAEVAADIAKYTSKMIDAIKGTMTEIYNDLSKNTTGSTIAEIRRLRIEIEKLQWLHQRELVDTKHNLELTMAEVRQSLEQERDRLIGEVKNQLELDKQQAVDETKKKQWCAKCKKEAIFYCCWNTSYCDSPCGLST